MDNDAPLRRQVMSRQGSALRRVIWQPGAEGRVWPFTVVVGSPRGQDMAEVSFAEWNHPIEALAPDSADQPFAIGIRPRCVRRRAQHLEGHRTECLFDGGPKDAVASVHDKSIGRVQGETIPELLNRPLGRRVLADIPVEDSPRGDVEHDEDVQVLKGRGHYDEEVAREDRAAMVVEERGPRLRRTATVGRECRAI
jgi:hypothetical protein